MTKLLTRMAVALAVVGAGIHQVPAVEGSAIAVLDRPEAPLLVVAGGSRVVASFAQDRDDLVLTMKLSAAALGAALIETEARLSDGQSHKIVLGADGGDSFTFTRRGGRIDVVAFDAVEEGWLAALDD